MNGIYGIRICKVLFTVLTLFMAVSTFATTENRFYPEL